MKFEIKNMAKPAFQSENDLISALREGDEVAFSQIFKKYWYPLYYTACSKLKSQAESEEVVQELLIALWEKRKVLLINNLEHYLHASLRNKCIDLIRQRATKEKYFDYCKSYFPTLASNSDYPAELEKAIENGISLLPEKSRHIFTLSKEEGLTKATIAEMKQLSEKAVEYHITKSIKQLRIHLKDFLAILAISTPFS
jgi:RNA polymerase sigma-70 factor (family 1)